MEKIISKLIDIDNMAKQTVKTAEQIKKNMDEIIEEKLEKEKIKIENIYKAKLNIKEQEIQEKLNKNKETIENKLKANLNQIDELYKKNQQVLVNRIVSNILKNS